jgi:hypothetical protein
MLSTDVYKDTEVAALRSIAKLCLEHNMQIEWKESGMTAFCPNHNVEVQASIRPRREWDGICITVRSRLGRRILDGQDYQFMAPECHGYTGLDVYLTALHGEF